MPGRKGQNRARLAKARSGEDWFKGPTVGGTGFGSRPRPPSASSTSTSTSASTATSASSSSTVKTQTKPSSSSAAVNSQNNKPQVQKETAKTTTTKDNKKPQPQNQQVNNSKPQVQKETKLQAQPEKPKDQDKPQASAKLVRPPILLPKGGFERSVDVSELYNKSADETNKVSGEKPKREKKPKAAQISKDDESNNGGDEATRSDSPPARKKAKASESSRMGLSRKRQRPKVPLPAEELVDPVVEALRKQLKHISKVAAIVTHKDLEVRKSVKFDQLIADFPMAEPITQKWRELDNAKNRKLVVRCLQGLKIAIMRQLRELKLNKLATQPPAPTNSRDANKRTKMATQEEDDDEEEGDEGEEEEAEEQQGGEEEEEGDDGGEEDEGDGEEEQLTLNLG